MAFQTNNLSYLSLDDVLDLDVEQLSPPTLKQVNSRFEHFLMFPPHFSSKEQREKYFSLVKKRQVWIRQLLNKESKELEDKIAGGKKVEIDSDILEDAENSNEGYEKKKDKPTQSRIPTYVFWGAVIFASWQIYKNW